MITDKVAALYVDPAGPYPGLVKEWFDVYRDARTFIGSEPVICHPPCESWGKFRNYPTRTRKGLKPCDDGGAFAFCVETVNANGGIIEHPWQSKAWEAFAGSLNRGTFITFDQGTYGFPAPKRTTLYCVNVQPGIDTRKSFATGRVEGMHSAHRHFTPKPLAELLVGCFK